MCLCGYPTVPDKKCKPQTLFLQNLQKIIKDLYQNFCFFSATTTFFICLLKSQRFSSSMPFNVIEMV